MASTYPSSREHDHDHDGGHSKGCPECDLGALDDLKCEAEGIKAQAEYTAAKQADLDKRRTQFDGARKAYSDARADVRDDIKEIRDQLTRLLDQLRCQLPEHVIDCLDRAWREVRERLEKCGMPTGCCIDDECEFDTDYKDVATDDLQKRKADYERRVKAAEDCFDALIKEPEELKKRVADLKAALEALAKDMADPKSDPKQSYARALWYWRRLEDIWLGFEHANEYHDCLCQALMCSVKGHKAIAVLVGQIAVRDCRDKAEKARCDWLKANVVAEILAVYVKLCPPRPHKEDEEEKPKKYDTA
jgi:predicted  nucleic acid-binding Zn-ribbon protein